MSERDIDALVEYWSLLDEDRELLIGKRGATALGFALLLKHYSSRGRFPHGRSDLPDDVIAFVSPQLVVVDLDGALVGAASDGAWTLAGLTITSTEDNALTATAPTGVSSQLDPRLWAGRTVSAGDFVALWQAAGDGGAIAPDGTAVSERQRLERVVAAVTAGDRSGAITELDRFVVHLREREGRVTQPWLRQLLSYTAELRGSLAS